MARKIVITSGKGGVGKTTICANLGTYLSKHNKRTLLIDVDIGLNNLDVVMGIENKVVFDLVDIMDKKCRAKQAVIQDATFPYLYVLPTRTTSLKRKYLKEEFLKVINELDDYFDYIIIDCPAGIDEGFHRAVYGADEAIVVVTPHISSIRDADKVISVLSSYPLYSIGVVVNRARGDMILNKEMISIEDINSILKKRIVGVVPEDDDISALSTLGGSVLGKSRAARAFTLLSENVLDGTSKIYDCTLKYKGIMGLFKRKIKRSI